MRAALQEQFIQQFGKDPLITAAPGRVNLIGEHTDYNEGFVLPGAIDKKIFVALADNGSRQLNFYANQYQQSFSGSLDDVHPVKGWPSYLLGMIHELQKRSQLSGLDVLIDGNVPVGAGMSSSAAICSAFGFALNELFGLGYSRMELALAGQQTEHRFVGVQCGIMDEFASLHGRRQCLMQLDCRSLSFRYVPFHFPDHKIVLVNTMVSHSLAGSEYNVRRRQCEEGVSVLQKTNPGLHSLRDATRALLDDHRGKMDLLIYNRCRFIVEENERVLKGSAMLEAGDLGSFGQLMFEAHEGLSKLYEVSCPESDFIVKRSRHAPGVAGARQMGGGFGGCVIHIVESRQVEAFSDHISEAYSKKYSVRPEVYVMQIEDGAGFA